MGVTTMLIVWSGVTWQSSEKEEGRDSGSVVQAQGTARTD